MNISQSRILESIDDLRNKRELCNKVVSFIKSKGVASNGFLRDFFVDTNSAGKVKVGGVIKTVREPSVKVITISSDLYAIVGDVKDILKVYVDDLVGELYRSDLIYYSQKVIEKRYKELHDFILDTNGSWPRNEKEFINSEAGKILDSELRDKVSKCQVDIKLSRKYKKFLPYNSQDTLMPICFIDFSGKESQVYFVSAENSMALYNMGKPAGDITKYFNNDFMFYNINNLDDYKHSKVFIMCLFDLDIVGDGVSLKNK